MLRFFIAVLISMSFTGFLVVASTCKTDGDCQVAGAVCTNGTCACPPDYLANSIYTSCLPIAHGYGASCSDSLQCSASLQSGGFCNNGTCDCEPGFHYFVGNCWKTSGLLEKCYTDQNCFIDQDFESSVCNAQKICVCKEGYYQREYSSCRLASYKPGDPCGIPMDCKFDNAVCLWNHTCSVNSSNASLRDISFHEHLASPSHGVDPITTNGFSKVGDKCSKASDCPTYAECLSSGVCLCLPGFYTLDGNTCYPEVGANCTADADCLGTNTHCKNKTYCACTEGHVISVDRRYCDKLSRYLGWSCLRDGWCAYFGPESVCINKKCACSNSSHYVADQMYCWITKKAGDSCESGLDCGMSGMSCDGGVCTCGAGSHPSTSGDECRPDGRTVGDKCVENIDCLFSNAACNATLEECICAPNYVFNGTHCLSGIGGPCNKTNSCFLENSQCAGDKCCCAAKYVPNYNGSLCLPQQTAMGGPCQDTNQCSHFDAVCTNGKCTCTSGHHFVEDWKCYKDVELGEACTRSGECVAPHSSCLKYVCTCDHGFRSDDLLCSNALLTVFSFPMALFLVASSIIYLHH